MNIPIAPLSPLNLSRLTWAEVEKEILRLPAVILPLGGLEPYGRLGGLGIASACAEALANALSEKMKLLCAPVLSFGCTIPYRSFGGSAGIKSRTLTNILCETIRGWFMQGFKAIIIIDMLTENGEALDLAVQRLKTSNPDCSILVFSIQKDRQGRGFIAGEMPGQELGRTERGMLSLAAWIDPALVREGAKEGVPEIPPDAERFKKWHKRGADPEQFRKYFPGASGSAPGKHYSADFGKRLFGYILEILEEKATIAADTTEPNQDAS